MHGRTTNGSGAPARAPVVPACMSDRASQCAEGGPRKPHTLNHDHPAPPQHTHATPHAVSRNPCPTQLQTPRHKYCRLQPWRRRRPVPHPPPSPSRARRSEALIARTDRKRSRGRARRAQAFTPLLQGHVRSDTQQHQHTEPDAQCDNAAVRRLVARRSVQRRIAVARADRPGKAAAASRGGLRAPRAWSRCTRGVSARETIGWWRGLSLADLGGMLPETKRPALRRWRRRRFKPSASSSQLRARRRGKGRR